MSKVLASLCNMPQPPASGLVLADFGSGEYRLLDLGLPGKIKSCTGLALESGWIYAMCITAEDVHYLAVLSAATFAPRNFYRLENVLDAHSILALDGKLYVASTRTDSVVRYDLSPEGLANPVAVWQASGEGRDTHHVNSIAMWNGDVVISAFGPKTGATWSTATGGYIHNLTQNCRVAEDIYQPHSLCAANGELYYCESAKGRIYALSGDCIEVGGYLRGLAFPAAGQFVAGTSVARKISKSTGIVNNPGDPGEPFGACALAVYNLNPAGPEKMAELSLNASGSEIYDVLVLDWAEPVNTGDETGIAGSFSAMPLSGEGDHLERVQELSELRYQLDAVIEERNEAWRQRCRREAEKADLEAKLEEASAEIAVLDGRLSHLTGQIEIMTKDFSLARQRAEAALEPSIDKGLNPDSSLDASW